MVEFLTKTAKFQSMFTKKRNVEDEVGRNIKIHFEIWRASSSDSSSSSRHIFLFREDECDNFSDSMKRINISRWLHGTKMIPTGQK